MAWETDGMAFLYEGGIISGYTYVEHPLAW